MAGQATNGHHGNLKLTPQRKMSANNHIRSFCFQFGCEQKANTSIHNAPSKRNKECEVTIPKCIVETLVSI
jgi:hypothetical protein